MRREEGGAEAEEGKLLLNEIRTGEQCASCGQWNGGVIDTRDVRRVGQGVY